MKSFNKIFVKKTKPKKKKRRKDGKKGGKENQEKKNTSKCQVEEVNLAKSGRRKKIVDIRMKNSLLKSTQTS